MHFNDTGRMFSPSYHDILKILDDTATWLEDHERRLDAENSLVFQLIERLEEKPTALFDLDLFSHCSMSVNFAK